MTQRGLSRFTQPAPPRTVRSATGAPDAAAAGTHAGDPDIAAPLAQLIGTRPRPAPGEACELCAVVVDDDHRHVVDLERRSLLCSCRGCALLFEFNQTPTHRPADARPGPGDHRYRTVPDRYLAIDPLTLPGAAWAALQIPVGIAFVVANTQMDRTVAFYPSPGGATESELPLDAWAEIVAANPGLEQAEPDVEAVLIRTGADGQQCHVVPVDRCYELVGALRTHWRGFDGGSEVRECIAAFFDDVASRSTRGRGVAPDREPTHPPRPSATPRPRSPDSALLPNDAVRSHASGVER